MATVSAWGGKNATVAPYVPPVDPPPPDGTSDWGTVNADVLTVAGEAPSGGSGWGRATATVQPYSENPSGGLVVWDGTAWVAASPVYWDHAEQAWVV